ncbi:hypothetical protein PMAYCL1PPCAC_12920 [Pristionchus mayeri]|uniref:Uncharacterized protein n=1 Tax=Pristionchus mayeri TaxID=1317129 RepID=A0AAN5CEI3_9BILA|nr:hypothetical protein PMAYCL1PPCAC_12920 [Pristionchus mayeri]
MQSVGIRPVRLVVRRPIILISVFHFVNESRHRVVENSPAIRIRLTRVSVEVGIVGGELEIGKRSDEEFHWTKTPVPHVEVLQ